MRKVIGIGETILDIIFRGNQPHAAVPGGSVFNGLVSLGRLGVDVLFISEIGNDRVGDIIQNFMQENHISTRYVDRFPDGKSPLSLAFLNENQDAQYTFYKDYPKQRLEVPLPPIEKDDIFIFGSYYSLNPFYGNGSMNSSNMPKNAEQFCITTRTSGRRMPMKPFM